MKVPSQITLHGISETTAIENKIQEKIQKLGQYFDHINFCRVVVDVPEKRKHQGKLFNVRIDITVPGKELVAKRDLHEDLYVAIRDAFKDAARELEDHGRMQRGDVKTHQELLLGKIVRLFPEGGYGFIESTIGEEYYFNASNVLHASFEDLRVGDLVEFLESIGGDSLQAVHVNAVKRKKRKNDSSQ